MNQPTNSVCLFVCLSVFLCLDHMYTDEGSCISSCGTGRTPKNESGVTYCVDCGALCPKSK